MFANLTSQVRNANHFNDADNIEIKCLLLGRWGGLGEGFGLVT